MPEVTSTTDNPTTEWWTQRPLVMLGVLTVFSALLAARDPRIILHASFWAEDGWIWYPDAYNFGFASLVLPAAGYLQTVSRLVGLAAQPFPLTWAPTIFAGAALVIQALPPAFLVSARMNLSLPDWRARLLFALFWVALPNTREVFVNLTNSQWHLAALLFLVLVSRPPASWSGRLFDLAILTISGLSGPFCGVLAPIAVWLGLTRRDSTSIGRMAVVLATTWIQAWFVMTTIGQRSPAPLGADALLLVRIVIQQIFLGALLGQELVTSLIRWPVWSSDFLPIVIAIVTAGLVASALVYGRSLLRLAVISTTLLFAAAMLHPQITGDGPQWPPMQNPGVGQRYYFLPMLAWLAVVFSLASAVKQWQRAVAAGLLTLFGFGLWSDWHIPPRAPSNFKAQARAFREAPAGTQVDFTFPPRFERSPMVLIKK